MQKRLATVSVFVSFFMTINVIFASCGAGKSAGAAQSEESVSEKTVPTFDADSAYAYVKRQVDFGPRVPNTEAHRRAGDWLVEKLKGFGAEVLEQKADLKAFDGTVLHSRNIFGSFNPEAERRILLLAHWDCRPWADEDPDEAKRSMPVDGANDGASGVGVILEIARQIHQAEEAPGYGVDVLFVDAEDWGTDNVEDSWALGTNYFVNNPIKPGYKPAKAILLDMVGSKDATFYKEYFSEMAAPGLNSDIWGIASTLGYGELFPPQVESAVTDDHRPLIEVGIPCIDIIDYRKGKGFDPVWHTTSDNMDNISAQTLKAVGTTVLNYIYRY